MNFIQMLRNDILKIWKQMWTTQSPPTPNVTVNFWQVKENMISLVNLAWFAVLIEDKTIFLSEKHLWNFVLMFDF